MQLIGHAAIRRELRTLAGSDSPAHALLLAGPDGTGRARLAVDYVQTLNCEADTANAGGMFADELEPLEPPCGNCRSCRLIESGSHPDVLWLSPGDALCKPRSGDSSHAAHPDSRDIRICQVRGLIDLAARYPFEARYRLIVIEPADRLAREASHTILKTLEEPPGHTIFALVTAAPEALLETIISRCRRIDVPPVPRAEIEAGLMAEGVDPALAEEAAAASRGRPGRAKTFAAEPGLMGDRARLLERCTRLAQAGIAERFKHAQDLTDQYRSNRASAANELDAWETFWGEELREASQRDDDDGREAARGALAALRAAATCREDLLANVMPRAAFELMLLTFPRLTLAVTSEEDTPTHV